MPVARGIAGRDFAKTPVCYPPLEGAEFYEYVGHPDLASSYRTRSGVRLGFYVGGLLALLGGAGYLLAGLGDPVDTDPDAPSPIEDRLWVSVGLMAGGGLLMAVPAFINPHPVSPVEARKLADEFNTGLKKELGLSARAPAPSREDRAVAVRLSPWTARSAGGLSLSLEF